MATVITRDCSTNA